MAGNKGKKRKSAGTAKHLSPALPLGFGINADQAYRLKRIVKDSINKFQQKSAAQIDATNILLRLSVGIYLCANILKMDESGESVVMSIDEGIKVMRAIGERFIQSGSTKWHMSPGEFEIIMEALDIIDEMQDQVTRRELLMAFRSAQRTMMSKGRIIDFGDSAYY